MHLVLGSQRHDLGRTVVIARVPRAERPVPGADALWADTVDDDLHSLSVPVGADAADAAAVHRLADAGASAVAVPAADVAACAAAAERGLTVLVPATDVALATGSLPSERVLVSRAAPVVGGVACFSPPGEGPAAWGAATRALVDGVRVLRGPDARSLRRVATVVDRLAAARQEARS